MEKELSTPKNPQNRITEERVNVPNHKGEDSSSPKIRKMESPKKR